MVMFGITFSNLSGKHGFESGFLCRVNGRHIEMYQETGQKQPGYEKMNRPGPGPEFGIGVGQELNSNKYVQAGNKKQHPGNQGLMGKQLLAKVRQVLDNQEKQEEKL